MVNDWDGYIRQYQHLIENAIPHTVGWHLKQNAVMMLRMIPALREQLDLTGLEVVTSHSVLTFWLPWQENPHHVKMQVFGQDDSRYQIYFYSIKDKMDIETKSDEIFVSEDELISTLQDYLNRLREKSLR